MVIPPVHAVAQWQARVSNDPKQPGRDTRRGNMGNCGFNGDEWDLTIEHGPVEIVDVPMKNGEFPWNFVCLPGPGNGIVKLWLEG